MQLFSAHRKRTEGPRNRENQIQPTPGLEIPSTGNRRKSWRSSTRTNLFLAETPVVSRTSSVRQRRTASLRPGAGWLIVCGETEFSSCRQRGHCELRRSGDVLSRGPRCNPWPDCGPRRAGESRGCRPISCKSKSGLWRSGVCRRSRRGARLRCA